MLKSTGMKRVFDGAPYTFESRYGNRVHPLTGKVTMHWGEDYGTYHKNVVLHSPVWGTVKRAEFNSARGWFVEIKTMLGSYVLMQHMKLRPNVSVGQKVKPGTHIGFAGDSGASAGIHLHIEFYNKLHQHQNPLYFWPAYKDPTWKTMKVNTPTLNVRNKPSEETGAIISKKHAGDIVTIYKTVEDSEGREWAKISYTEELYVAKWLLV